MIWYYLLILFISLSCTTMWYTAISMHKFQSRQMILSSSGSDFGWDPHIHSIWRFHHIRQVFYIYSWLCCEFSSWSLSCYLIQVIASQLPHTTPFPGPCSVLIMDNCKIHHHDDIRQLIEASGMSLCHRIEIFLYSVRMPSRVPASVFTRPQSDWVSLLQHQGMAL